MDFLLSKEGTLGPLSELFTGDSFSISVRKTLLWAYEKNIGVCTTLKIVRKRELMTFLLALETRWLD